MKRVRCPKCDSYITFDETRYEPGQKLVFQCPDCQKQFAIRLGNAKADSSNTSESESSEQSLGCLIVVENQFHFKQILPLKMGDNQIGRSIKGTNINLPIETVDPSVDTLHCIVRVQRNKRGELQYLLRDAPSLTGTFLMGHILKDNENAPLSEGDIITIGATTMIVSFSGEEE